MEKLKGEGVFILSALAAVAVLFTLSLSVPIFGDSLGYGYETANWIRDNGYTPFAAGEGRGQQAMGHPTLFFWAWAVLSGVFGETLAVARLLPAAGVFFSLWGMYRLGCRLVSSSLGWLAALALLASPLFLIQGFRPMPESAVVAAVVWSLYFYLKGNYFRAALLCSLGVVFREQAIFLAGAYFISELIETRFRYPKRLLLFLSPLLVIVFTGLINLVVNGYFFFPSYAGDLTPPPPGWFFTRLRLFGAHLLAEDYRWLPVTAMTAAFLKGRGRDSYSFPFVAALLFPALFFPPERILFLLFAAGGTAVHLIRERLYITKLTWVFITMPLMLVFFHVAVVLVSPDKALDLFRYILPGYPLVILGTMAILFRYYSRSTAIALSVLFIAGTLYSNRFTPRPGQPDTSLACASYLLDYGEAVDYAVSLGDTILVSGIDAAYFTNPECGAVSSPVPVVNILHGRTLDSGAAYTLVVASFMGARGNIELTEGLLPVGSSLVRLEEPSWERRGFTIDIFRVTPGGIRR